MNLPDTDNSDLLSALSAAKAYLSPEELARAMDELQLARWNNRRVEGLKTAGSDKCLRWWSYSGLQQELELLGRDMRIEGVGLPGMKELHANARGILDRGHSSEGIKSGACWTGDFYSKSPDDSPYPVFCRPNYGGLFGSSFEYSLAYPACRLSVVPCLRLSGPSFDKRFSVSGFSIGTLRFRLCVPGMALCCESIGRLPMEAEPGKNVAAFSDCSLSETVRQWFEHLMEGFSDANNGLYY